MATLVLLGVGKYREFAFKTIFRQRHRLILVDKSSNHRYFAFADIPIMVDPEDTTCVIEALKELQTEIDGVLTFLENLVPAAATVSDALGLPGNDLQAVTRARNKVAMREAFSRHGLPVPQFAPVSNLREAHEAAEKIGYPVVVKPVDYGGSVGVVRVDSQSELGWAFEHARKRTRRSVTLVEEFLDGPEFYVNAAVCDGQTLVAFVSDRAPDKPGPFFAELGSNALSNLPLTKQEQLISIAEQGVTSLGIRHGLTHTEIRWTHRGPRIIEIGARAGGGLQIESLYLSYGINLYDIALDLAIGRRPKLKPRKTPLGSAVRFLTTKEGRVVRVSGVQGVMETIEGISDLAIYVLPGSVVKPLDSNSARIGHLMVTADTGTLASERADKAVNMISIEVV